MGRVEPSGRVPLAVQLGVEQLSRGAIVQQLPHPIRLAVLAGAQYDLAAAVHPPGALAERPAEPDRVTAAVADDFSFTLSVEDERSADCFVEIVDVE